MSAFRPILVCLAVLFSTAFLTLPASADTSQPVATFTGFDGFLVHSQSWNAPSGGKDEKAIVLLHGFTLDATYWRHQVPVLAQLGRVVAVDLPGHGQSGKPADKVYDQKFYADSVAAVLDDLGVKKAAIIGHSMGFPVAMVLAQKRPDLVLAMVSVDGAIFNSPAGSQARAAETAWVKGFTTALRQPDYRTTMQGFILPFAMKSSPDLRQELAAQAAAIPQHVAVTTMETFMASPAWDTHAYNVPLLALHAKPVPPGVEEWLQARFAKVDFKAWDDVDHFLQLGQPDRINSAMSDFLNRNGW